MKKSVLLFNLFLSISAFPQRGLDSLKQLLKQEGLPDTSLLIIKNELVKQQVAFHCSLGNSDSAIFYAKKLVDFNQLNHHKTELAHARHCLSLAYRSKKDWRSALVEEEKSLSMHSKAGNKSGCAESLQSLSEIHLIAHHFRESLRNATLALNFARQTNSRSVQKSVLRIMAMASYELRLFGMANRYWQKYDSLNELLHKNEKLQLLANAETMHNNYKNSVEIKLNALETKLKAQEIELLNERSLRQEQEIAQQELITNVVFGAASIFLGLLFITLYQYHLKRRSVSSLARNKKELKEKNASLQKLTNNLEKAFTDKDLLMKEIHQRFKKTVQLIHSILSVQNGSNSPIAIKSAQGRILAMSLIHQRLYSDDNVVGVEFLSYTRDLMEWLKKMHSHPDQKIYSSVKGSEFILNADVAIPLGLILVELITNSLEHTFNHSQERSIELEVVHAGANSLILDYYDSDPGIQSDFDPSKSHVLNGQKLISKLIVQLDGKITFSYENGFSGKLVFNNIRLRTSQKSKTTNELITT